MVAPAGDFLRRLKSGEFSWDKSGSLNPSTLKKYGSERETVVKRNLGTLLHDIKKRSPASNEISLNQILNIINQNDFEGSNTFFKILDDLETKFDHDYENPFLIDEDQFQEFYYRSNKKMVRDSFLTISYENLLDQKMEAYKLALCNLIENILEDKNKFGSQCNTCEDKEIKQEEIKCKDSKQRECILTKTKYTDIKDSENSLIEYTINIKALEKDLNVNYTYSSKGSANISFDFKDSNGHVTSYKHEKTDPNVPGQIILQTH